MKILNHTKLKDLSTRYGVEVDNLYFNKKINIRKNKLVYFLILQLDDSKTPTELTSQIVKKNLYSIRSVLFDLT